MPSQTPHPNKEEAAFVRLHALVAKGYHADLGMKSDIEFIRLEHPRGPDAGAPSLTLCSNGLIMGNDNIRPLSNGEGDPDSIDVYSEADWRDFQSFLNGIPEPTVWQALDAKPFWQIRSDLVFGLVSGAIGAGFAALAIWAWRTFAGEG
jgi:hypothetical protein